MRTAIKRLVSVRSPEKASFRNYNILQGNQVNEINGCVHHWLAILCIFGLLMLTLTLGLSRDSKRLSHGGDVGAEELQSCTQGVTDGISGMAKDFLSTKPEMCEKLQKLDVCSHQALAGELRLADGSIAAVKGLLRQGITCFDMDFVVTSDGHLLAAHPERLQQAAKEAGYSEPVWNKKLVPLSLVDVRAAGLDNHRFPTMSEVLDAFFDSMVHADVGSPIPPGGGPERTSAKKSSTDNLLLLLDMKFAAFSEAAVAAAMQMVTDRGLQHITTLWFGEDAPTLRTSVQSIAPAVRTIRVFRDRGELPSVITVQQAAKSYDMLGPSIKMPAVLLNEMVKAGGPVLGWVVDDEPALKVAVEHGLQKIVSNKPLAMQYLRHSWRCACQAFLEQKLPLDVDASSVT